MTKESVESRISLTYGTLRKADLHGGIKIQKFNISVARLVEPMI